MLLLAAHKSSDAVAKSASNNLRELVLSPTGQLNFGFTTEGKLTAMLFTPSSWDSQLVRQHRRINKFSGVIAGENEDFCKGRLSLPIFLHCFCLACFLYFIFVCFFLLKIQKIVSFIVGISLLLLLVHYVDPRVRSERPINR
jgi:hypothetical protein